MGPGVGQGGSNCRRGGEGGDGERGRAPGERGCGVGGKQWGQEREPEEGQGVGQVKAGDGARGGRGGGEGVRQGEGKLAGASQTHSRQIVKECRTYLGVNHDLQGCGNCVVIARGRHMAGMR